MREFADWPMAIRATAKRIDHGPGYRVYFTRRGRVVIVLLVGGDKRTQDDDIERAVEMAKDWKE